MFFEPPLTTLKGVQTDTPRLANFQSSLHTLQSQDQTAAAKALEASLQAWEQAVADVAADKHYDPRERYCLQQSWLWAIYDAARQLQMESNISRTIYKRACRVLEQTPKPGRPADLSFRQGNDLIRKMLEHLQLVTTFYQAALSGVTTQRGPHLPPPAPGFQRTNVLETTEDPAIAEAIWQIFIQDNQYVRTILLGDATTGATIVDNCLTVPGDPIVPGRGLWIKSHTLLRQAISTWLGAKIPHDYDQVRCIFISPKGQPVSYLSKTDPLSYSTVSLKLVQAAKAGLS